MATFFMTCRGCAQCLIEISLIRVMCRFLMCLLVMWKGVSCVAVACLSVTCFGGAFTRLWMFFFINECDVHMSENKGVRCTGQIQKSRQWELRYGSDTNGRNMLHWNYMQLSTWAIPCQRSEKKVKVKEWIFFMKCKK